jgi:lambda family phage tail tape measure protein
MAIKYEAILVDKVTPSLQKIRTETNSLKVTFGGLKAVLGALAGALATKELVEYTARWTDLNSRFKNAIGDAGLANEALKQIAQTARSTYSNLEQTAETFLRNSQTLKELGFTTAEQIQLSDALNNALAISGTKGARAESVMNALSKAMALGKLSGDNLNTVLESGGRIAQALADGLGVTTLQLRELAAAGKIDTITMVEALTSQMERLRQESADMPVTARDGFVLLNNAVFEFVGRLDTAIGSSTSFGEKLAELADAIISLAQNTEKMAKLAIVVTEVAKAIGTLVAVVGTLAVAVPIVKGFMAAWAGAKAVVAGVGAIGTAVKALPLTGLKAFAGKGAALLGLGKGLVTTGVAALGAKLGFDAYNNVQEKFAEVAANTTDKSDDLSAALAKQEEAARLARAAYEALKAQKLAREFEDINTQLQLAGRSYYENNRQQLESLRIQNSLMDASAQQVKLSQSLTENERSFGREKQRIEDALAKARVDASRDEEDAKRKALITIPILEEQLNKLTTAYKNQGAEITKLVEENEKLIQAKQFQTFATQRQIEQENQLQAVMDDINKLTMSETEKKYYDIAAAAKASAKAAIEAEEARRGTPLNAAEQAKYYEEAARGSEQLIELHGQLFEQSRMFSTGWKNALKNYTSDATNAAKQAERIFTKATQGMEDAIVGFAKTGKFEFRSFVNSMLEELLRSQVRQMMAGIFNIGSMGGASGSGGGGGLLSSIGNLLGFANGGIIPTNAPVIVGERGPEILSGASGRVVTPNSQLGMGTTNVVYNISAVDARSFKDLVASDPGFIFAVTQQGAKGVPGRR